VCLSNQKVTWKFRDGPLPNNHELSVSKKWPINWNSLVIYSISELDEGNYSCVGEDEDLLVFVASVALKVESK